MPNWVDNIISVAGSEADISAMLDFIKDDDKPKGYIDFEKVVPMPKELDIDISGSQHEIAEIYLTAVNPKTADYGLKKLKNEEYKEALQKLKSIQAETVPLRPQKMAELLCSYSLENVKAFAENYLKFGFMDWYSWRCSYWGTKWNGCECSEFNEANQFFSFDTAWSPPVPVIQELSKAYPSIVFNHFWVEENGYGEHLIYSAGNLITAFEANFPKEVNEMFAGFFGTDFEYYSPDEIGVW